MSLQRMLVALALVAGVVAGSLYYAGTQRVGVVAAARYLAPGRAIGPADVETRWLPPDAIPADAITEGSNALGWYPRAPMWSGQLLLSSALARASAAFGSGLVPPTGYRAIAIPVSPDQAIGGAIAPGARVDVIAVPLPGRAPVDQGAELLTEAALVLDVRGEHGGAYGPDDPSERSIGPKELLGSVVIAIGPSEELLIADRIPRSSFVLVLVPERP